MICVHCEAGFPKQDGFHYGTQRLGMIPDTPCGDETVRIGFTITLTGDMYVRVPDQTGDSIDDAIRRIEQMDLYELENDVRAMDVKADLYGD